LEDEDDHLYYSDVGGMMTLGGINLANGNTSKGNLFEEPHTF
jgi:hypothetical protein